MVSTSKLGQKIKSEPASIALFADTASNTVPAPTRTRSLNFSFNSRIISNAPGVSSVISSAPVPPSTSASAI